MWSSTAIGGTTHRRVGLPSNGMCACHLGATDSRMGGATKRISCGMGPEIKGAAVSSAEGHAWRTFGRVGVFSTRAGRIFGAPGFRLQVMVLRGSDSEWGHVLGHAVHLAFLVVPWVGSSTESVDKLRKGLQRRSDALANEAGAWRLKPGARFATGRPDRRQHRPTRGWCGLGGGGRSNGTRTCLRAVFQCRYCSMASYQTTAIFS